MRVIMLLNVAGVGLKGAIVSVSDGYATNFLIPQKLAETATEKKIGESLARKAEMEAASVRQMAEWKDHATRLANASVTLRSTANEKGQLYASIPHARIIERISKELGISLSEDSLKYIKPIKSIGRAEVELVLGGRQVPFTVFVERLQH